MLVCVRRPPPFPRQMALRGRPDRIAFPWPLVTLLGGRYHITAAQGCKQREPCSIACLVALRASARGQQIPPGHTLPQRGYAPPRQSLLGDGACC